MDITMFDSRQYLHSEGASDLSLRSVGSSEIHMYCTSVRLSREVVRYLHKTLSADERERAKRFHRQRDQSVSIVSRGILRLILSSYTGTAPGQLTFKYGANGKPALNDHAIYFNVSHSNDLVAYAIAREQRIGVDIEYRRHFSEMMPITEGFFSDSECGEISQLESDEEVNAFFDVWTRKEAYVKALGCGLTMPLNSFTVSIAARSKELTLKSSVDPDLSSRWSLHNWHISEHYSGAIAIFGKGWIPVPISMSGIESRFAIDLSQPI